MLCPQQIRGQRSEVGGQRSETRNCESEIRNQTSEAGSEELDLHCFIERAYSQGIAAHGDLGLGPEDFSAHLEGIIIKQLGADAAVDSAIDLLAGLDLDDLYLTSACALNLTAAWDRLFKLYSDHVSKVAHQVCLTHQQARDLAGDVLTHLFFEDRSGRRRIASYEGRGSLRTWLATIIRHRAVNQSQLKALEGLPLEALRHTACDKAAGEFDATLMRGKYHKVIADAFESAAEGLTEREKLVLILRFDEEMTGTEIAKTLGVHPAQVTRTTRLAQVKFRTAVVTRLNTYYGLGSGAIEECVAEMFERHYAIGAFLQLRASAPEANRELRVSVS
jgi:RNA polymerase sigma factor (sigma-70 family)